MILNSTTSEIVVKIVETLVYWITQFQQTIVQESPNNCVLHIIHIDLYINFPPGDTIYNVFKIIKNYK